MKDEDLLERIVLNPKVMAGKPVIRGRRLTVKFLLGLLAQGATPEGISEEYEGLSKDDILACIFFASEALDSSTYTPISEEV